MKKIKTILTLFLLFLLFFLPQPCLAQSLTSQEIDKYIWKKEVIIDISPAARDLREELAEEIQKMITAGHLAPYIMAPTEDSYLIYLWYHAGEPIYTLSEALKYLPESDLATKQALKDYLEQEVANYPPYIPTAVYNRAPWLPLDKGTRREYYPLETIPVLASHLNQGHPVIQTFYHLWNYVDATGDSEIIVNHWSQIKSLFDKLKDRAGEDKAWMDRGGCVTKYGDIAGCIGMARIAYLAQQQGAIDEAAARLLEGFNNGLDFARFEENAAGENQYFKETSAGRSIRSYVFLNLFPETARFLKEHNLTAVQNHLINNLSWNIPTWYATLSSGFAGGEVNFIAPLISYPMFQAYAQILDKNPEWLRKRLDVPLAKVGDLYYIQNLVSTIKAYGQTCWDDITTEENECELAFTKGDVNHDGRVDKDDALMVLGNWGRAGNGDANDNGKVNGMDLGLVIRDWGKK